MRDNDKYIGNRVAIKADEDEALKNKLKKACTWKSRKNTYAKYYDECYTKQIKYTHSLHHSNVQTEKTAYQRTITNGIISNCIGGRISQCQRITVAVVGNDTSTHRRY